MSMSLPCFQLRTSVGVRLAGLDTLSNDPPTDAELERFRVPLAPLEVRQKLREVQARMAEHADLFDGAEVYIYIYSYV